MAGKAPEEATSIAAPTPPAPPAKAPAPGPTPRPPPAMQRSVHKGTFDHMPEGLDEP